MALVKQFDTILVNQLNLADPKIAYIGVRVRAFLAGVEQQLYSDEVGTPTSLVQTDVNGYYQFWIEEGEYELRFSIGGQPLGSQDYELYSLVRQSDLAASGGAGKVGFSHSQTYPAATVGSKLKRFVYVTDAPYNADSTGTASSTAAIQAAIDAVYAAGGGVVAFPDGSYQVTASTLSETYDNDGVPVAASTGCIIQRAGVSLVGLGHRSARIFTDDNTKSVIYQIAPVNCAVKNLEIHAAWDAGEAGAGHGIICLGTTGGADRSCRNNLYSDLYIHNVGSYGIGLQQGSPTRCKIENVDIADIGADGLDLKARSDIATEPSGNTVSNVTIRNHGQRVTGSNGVDIRGVWSLSNVHVTDFGGNAALAYGGVRFRTKPAPTDAYNRAAARSTATNIYVRPTIGAAASSIVGIENGSDDVAFSNVVTEDCTYGYVATGNVNGSARRTTITGFIAIGSRIYGFFIGTGCEDQTLIACHTIGSATAGIRNEGLRTKIIGCDSTSDTSPLSTAGIADPTQIIVGGSLGVEIGVSNTFGATGRAGLQVRGISTNIDFELVPKGTGVLRYGTHTANADAPITGYITIKDSGGTTRKLAVIT